MNQVITTNEAINTLLIAPIFPDSENLYFPHNTFPPTDESIEKVKAILASSRTRVDAEQVNFLFKGSYQVKSVPLEYRNDEDVADGYKNVSPNDNYSFEIAIESFVEYLSNENDFQSSKIRFAKIDEITHTPPFPSHPLIKNILVNGLPITAQTHEIELSVLENMMKSAQECFDNCEHGGGFIPYCDSDEYLELYLVDSHND